MKTCATCRFMAAKREKYVWDDETDHRSCVRIKHGNGGEASPDESAVVVDGSGYTARLLVLPTFGCALHEEMPDPEDS